MVNVLISENLNEVIIYSSPDDSKRKNRGFAFLEYTSHKDASVAKRRIGNGRTRVWNCDIIVDWADPQEEPDDDTMSKVRFRIISISPKMHKRHYSKTGTKSNGHFILSQFQCCLEVSVFLHVVR